MEIFKDAGVPRTLVERAKQLKNEADASADMHRDDNPRYDEVWRVFDVDEHPRVKDAREMARTNGLKLAMSNPVLNCGYCCTCATTQALKRVNIFKKCGDNCHRARARSTWTENT